MDGRTTRSSDRRRTVRLPAWFPAAFDRAFRHRDAILVAHANQTLARCEAGTARFRDESRVFADLVRFARTLGSPSSGAVRKAEG